MNNYSRTATSTSLVRRPTWSGSYVPVFSVWLLELWVWVLPHTLPFRLEIQKLEYYPDIGFFSQVHGKKLTKQENFVSKTSTPELQPPCCAAKGMPWGCTAPHHSWGCCILRISFPPRVKDTYFMWKTNKQEKGTGEFWYLSIYKILLPNGLFKILPTLIEKNFYFFETS